MEESLTMIDRNKRRAHSEAPSPREEQPPNYIPQVTEEMRERLNNIAHRLSTEIETS
jgi:hypothetical protein